MKLLEADEENLLEGKGERTDDLREPGGRGIAAEKEIEDELLAGGKTGDQRTAVARKTGGDRVVRRTGAIGKRLKRRTRGGEGARGRGLRNRRDEVEHQLDRLARLMRRKEIAQLRLIARRARRDLVAARDELVRCLPEPGN